MSLIDSSWLKANNYHLFHYEPMGNGREGVVEVDADTIPTTWIPVSERLPEGYADVLCCNKYAEMMIGMIYENSASDTRFSVESDAEIMHDVIAWMPLPEPYKG